MPREPKFLSTVGAITYSIQDIAGVTLSSNKKAEKTYEETIEDVEKADLLDERKDLITTKMKAKKDAIRKQGEPNPKRFTVDPDTGQIDVDEEEGEYTQKEAMIRSASIKGTSGQYDAAIALITAAKALAPENQPVAERPKEFYVDSETGTIVKDPENGEYTLSEARAISQSIRKEKAPVQAIQKEKTFLEKLEDITQGMISQRIAAMLGGDNTQKPHDPVDEVINRLDQADKLKQRFGGAVGTGAQSLAQSGIRGELMKLLLEDERDRLKMQYEHESQMERNKHLGSLAGTVKDNLADGIAALRAAASEFKATGTGEKIATQAAQPQTFECGTCKTKFTLPPGTQLQEGQKLKCPGCGQEWGKEEVGA